jgi:hypothetical protein
MQRLNRKVTSSIHYLRLSTSVADFIILVLAALTTELETAKKSLFEDKNVQLVADQSLAEEMATQQSTD